MRGGGSVSTYHYLSTKQKEQMSFIPTRHRITIRKHIQQVDYCWPVTELSRGHPQFTTKHLSTARRLAWKRSDLVPGPSQASKDTLRYLQKPGQSRAAHCHHQQLRYTSEDGAFYCHALPPALLESSVDPRKLDHTQFCRCADMHIRCILMTLHQKHEKDGYWPWFY